MDELKCWLRDLGVFLVSLLGEIALWFGEIGDFLIKSSPILDALIKFFMAAILFAYFIKVFIVNVDIPIISSIIKKIKKSMGLRNRNIATIEIAENGTEFVEEKMIRGKTIVFMLFELIKKGFRLMKKLFGAIGKFLYHNKITLSGWLALLIAIGACAIRFYKPELITKFITNKELIASIIALVSWTSYAIFGVGIENQEAWDKRHEEKWAADAVKKEQNEKLRQELQKNKLVKVIKKEIETNIIPILQERLLQEAKSGILSNYRSITNLFPELHWEYIIEDLGNDQVKIDELLAQLDELARQNNLIDVKNGVEVNLIIEELKK